MISDAYHPVEDVQRLRLFPTLTQAKAERLAPARARWLLPTRVIRSDLTEIQCPNCGSTRIKAKRHGRKFCGITGTAIGTVGGVTAAARSSRLDASVGFALVPSGSAVGRVTGALICGISGAMTGGSAGAALGEKVDETMLDNFGCLACQHAFNMERDEE